MQKMQLASLVAACGLAAPAFAQITDTYTVTGSGATLQESFFRSASSTNDFIDVDGDGTAGSLGSLLIDQLAPQSGDLGPAPFPANLRFIQHYRLSGSGNGIAEFDAFARLFDTQNDNFDTDGDGGFADDLGNSARTDNAIYNRRNLVTAGVLQGIGVSTHRSGAPFITFNESSATPYRAGSKAANGASVGFQVDFAASDVPLSWFAIQSGASRPDAAPSSSGYGSNARLATDAAGNNVAWDNLLRPLTRLNTNVASPNSLTVYETAVTLAPVAAIVNPGVGLTQIDMSDLRILNASGRRANGENLMVITRDSGSGTRNTFHNGIGLDPSFGVGENIGVQTNSSSNDVLGANFQPSNKGGSSRMDATAQNHRLAMGHSSAERGVPGSGSPAYLTDEELEVLAVRSDIKGGTVFARPNIANIVNGGPNGYNIVGPAAFSHIGDPRNAPASLGGWGWDPSETGPNPFAGNPAPVNAGLSAYINNITRSLANVVAAGSGDPDNDFMPGERLFSLYLLPNAAVNVPQSPVTVSSHPIPTVANSAFNSFVSSDTLVNSVLANAAYNSYNTTTSGRVPNRTTSTTYTDGNTGSHYRTVDGTLLNYGSRINDTAGASINKIAGDFNGNGARTADDVADMIAAWRLRNGGTPWTTTNAGNSTAKIAIELIGDFNGDGNFTAADIRYWADGLHLVGGNLDRKAGFTAVDAAFAGNFFGTTLVTGTYANGDARADIFGPSSKTTRGYRPIGQDGTVNAFDIDYVIANQGDWSNLTDAANIDLSADMNGDLVVDCDDVTEIVVAVLDSELGDVNLDGVRNAADLAIVNANIGNPGTYAQGDLDCDGIVTANDANIAQGCAAVDFTNDGQVDSGDLSAFIVAFISGNLAADLTNDGQVDSGDLSAFIAGFLNCA